MLEAKRNRLVSHEGQFRRNHVEKRTPCEKLELLNESKQIYDELRNSHEECKRLNAQFETQSIQSCVDRETANYETRQQEKLQKLQEAKDVMEANKQLAEMRKQRERQEKLESHVQDKVNVNLQMQASERRSFR